MNAECCTELYRKYYDTLVAYAARCLNESQAEDIVHDVFVRLLENRSSTVIGNVNAYLKTMTRNEAIRHYRYREVRKRRGASPIQSNFSDDVHERLIEKERHKKIIKVIEDLAARQRHIFELRCMHSLKRQQIADLLDISPITVKNHWAIILRKFERMVA